MKITGDTKNGVCRLHLEGEMTICNAEAAKKALLAMITGDEALELELSGVSEMDTAGFQLLLALRTEAERLNRGFSIASSSEAVQNVIRLYNMQGCFPAA